MTTGILTSLPATYRSQPVIPFAPNAPDDRAHQWDWARDQNTNAVGMNGVLPHALYGTETITLGYVGLTRSDARTLEAFAEIQVGRSQGFWCPTFQHEFVAVPKPAGDFILGAVFFREWGYASQLFPLGLPARHYYVTLGPQREIDSFSAIHDTGSADFDGIPIFGYERNGFTGVGDDVIGQGKTTAQGMQTSRMLWVRFAAEAITTNWSHPNLADITLNVVSILAESP